MTSEIDPALLKRFTDKLKTIAEGNPFEVRPKLRIFIKELEAYMEKQEAKTQDALTDNKE